jgi:hypothetical protein
MSLQQELQTDPLGLGYAQFVPQAPGLLVEMLNAPNYTKHKSRFVTARTVLAEVADGATILDKLETAAQTNSAVKWAMRFITTDGIDVGYPVTQQLLDSLVGTTLTQTESDSLKNLALQPASRAEVLGFAPVTEEQVRNALGL